MPIKLSFIVCTDELDTRSSRSSMLVSEAATSSRREGHELHLAFSDGERTLLFAGHC